MNFFFGNNIRICSSVKKVFTGTKVVYYNNYIDWNCTNDAKLYMNNGIATGCMQFSFGQLQNLILKNYNGC